VDPLARHVRHEHIRVVEHAVTRMDALAAVKSHRDLRAAHFFDLAAHA